MELNEKRIAHQIRNFERVIRAYNYKEPLARFLTTYYKENKQMGSSDRRMTSRLCYNFFRIGSLAYIDEVIQRLTLAEYLCEKKSDIVSLLRPDLAETIHLESNEKISLLGIDNSTLFPNVEMISQGLDTQAFLNGQLEQPDLFIRIKRGYEEKVKRSLIHNVIAFEEIGPQTLALTNGTKLQNYSSISGLFEVQDLSSQQTIDFIDASAGGSWWDACAASGGKALMLLDKYPHMNLLVSDIRLSILRNLDERFNSARITIPYRKKFIDLTKNIDLILQGETFDGIVLDVPCSGSGTWGRTPEMKAQFSKEKLNEFSDLQRTISSNVIAHLKPGKPLTYITCSVYSSENEDIVNYLVSEHRMILDRMEILKGYTQKADTMFVARLIKD